MRGQTLGQGGIPRQGDNVALASSVSGTTLKLRPPAGIYDGVDDNVTLTDADFIAGNIKSGVNLFGVAGSLSSFEYTAGTLEEKKHMVSGVWTDSATYSTAATYKVNIKGVVTVRFAHRVDNPSYPGKAIITKNGVQQGSEFTTTVNGAGGTTQNLNVSVNPGDILRVQIATSTDGYITYLIDTSIRVGTPSIVLS